MKTLKEIGKFLIFMAILAGVGWFMYETGKLARKFPDPFRQEQEEPLVIEIVFELQERVGARRDGKIGPETMGLANAQSELDEPIYFNKCAAPYYTASGAPRKEN